MTSPVPEHLSVELLKAAGPGCWEVLTGEGRSDIRQDVIIGLLEHVMDEELFALACQNLLKLKYGRPKTGVNSAVGKASAYGDVTILDTLLRLAWVAVTNGRARILLSWSMESALERAAVRGDVPVVQTLQKHGGQMGARAWTLLIQTGKPECLNHALSSPTCAPEISWKSALLRCMEEGKDQEAVRIYNTGRAFFSAAAVVVAGSWFGRNLVDLPTAVGCAELSITEKRLLRGHPGSRWFAKAESTAGRAMESGEGYASSAQVVKYVILNFQTVPEDSPALDDLLLLLQMEGDLEGMDAVAALWDRDW